MFKYMFRAFFFLLFLCLSHLVQANEGISIPLSEEDGYFFDDSLGEIANSQHFDVDVEYAPKRYRPGYVFKITFNPRSDSKFKRIRQNYLFLLDRSNSIPRPRYALNKQAISKVLDHLKSGDTFNILLFDNRVVRLAEHNLPWNDEHVMHAREFLEKQGHGGFFAATELYASLWKTIPENVSDTEVNTAILLSDGDTYLSLEKQRRMIGGWSEHNNGKVSLFSVASGTGNNLPLLDLISVFNKGFLVYTHNHQLLEERLNKLIYSIRTPIGKDLSAEAFPKDKQMTIILQPKNGRLPDLYQESPFIIYGSTNRLSDFTIFLKGKYYDRSFDIKKEISFKEARIGSFIIEQKWTQLLVQDFYEHFFQDGNIAHLEAARQLLAPLNQSVPLLKD